MKTLSMCRWMILILGVLVVGSAAVRSQDEKRPDILIADFEGETYGDWKAEGEAFGKGPARGTLPGQMHVDGFRGKGLVNSFNGGDKSTGKLTSPAFKIERKFITFLIGGGGWANETCMNLVIDGKVVRTATGPNTKSGGSETLEPASWDVAEFTGREATLVIVDEHKGGWGHVTVDHIVQSDTNPVPAQVALKKTFKVDGTHLIVPVSNSAKVVLLGIYEGDKLVQSFHVALPLGDEPFWLAAYPLDNFGLKGKEITVAPVDRPKLPESNKPAFDRITVGAASDALKADDYSHPYRDQFHVTTRRGWNNDPNGMVYHDGKYHLYYQHNPLGIGWGNMHWGHFESKDLIHWEEKPIALFQKTVRDAMFSGGGFVDANGTAGLGKNTLFVAFTSTGRGECLAYSKDGGLTFTELKENPVVKHNGRDPKVIWYKPEQKWVMVVFDGSRCAETDTVPAADAKLADNHNNLTFYESKNLREWKRTGAFTDPDRMAVFECPELFELPVQGKEKESRWVLFGAQNRYFIGKFDGKTFTKESGPHGDSRGAMYAAQTFSDAPDGRRIQIGWVRTGPLGKKFPNQIVSQGFTLPQELLLRETSSGLRMFIEPVKEVEHLRDKLLAEGADALKACQGEQTEVLIEFEKPGRHELVINGIDASFTGQHARIFTDRTFNEVYIDGGLGYTAKGRVPPGESTETVVKKETPKSIKVYRLKSIWNENASPAQPAPGSRGENSGRIPEIPNLKPADVSYLLEAKLPDLQEAYLTCSPRDLADGIPVGQLGSDGGVKESILKFAREIETGKHGEIDSLLISHRGKLVFESYYRRGRINYPHFQMSITKSYTAMAIGRAIQLGHLTMEDLDKPIVNFLGKLEQSKLVKGAASITLAEAMNMCSGVRIDEAKVNELMKQPATLRGQGQIQVYLENSAPIPVAPREFKYQSADTCMAMQVLEARVPRSAREFIEKELLGKMGITNFAWETDVSGLPKSSAGSSILSRDMLKWGMLVRSNGKWNGEQLIPAKFVEKATSRLHTNKQDTSYGYFWWRHDMKVGDKKFDCISGRGAGGQFILNFSELDLIVVVTAHHKGMGTTLATTAEQILPSFIALTSQTK